MLAQGQCTDPILHLMQKIGEITLLCYLQKKSFVNLSSTCDIVLSSNQMVILLIFLPFAISALQFTANTFAQ
jgi:hypothetical protein